MAVGVAVSVAVGMGVLVGVPIVAVVGGTAVHVGVSVEIVVAVAGGTAVQVGVLVTIAVGVSVGGKVAVFVGATVVNADTMAVGVIGATDCSCRPKIVRATKMSRMRTNNVATQPIGSKPPVSVELFSAMGGEHSVLI